jgi:membrane associated rhomboid family serine protease
MRQKLRERGRDQVAGVVLLVGIVAVMWIVEIFNALDGNALSNPSHEDGIIARSPAHLWGILTSPFIHASFTHLLDNTIPFVFLGLIIALAGAARLATVTALIVVLGGLGTWLIAPAGTDTIGASGVVFGYATYLMARGFFDRRLWEILVGVIVAVVWGGVLLASLIPHQHVSWQAHLCGGIAGVLVAWRLAARDRRSRPQGQALGLGPDIAARLTPRPRAR